MSDISDFTKLVLARLETNPDEFQIGGRWDTLVRGIEAYVRGDKDDRYYRTLWPLDDPEIHVIVAAYRKAYLARLHKDMLKNIVSGEDLNRGQYTLSNDINPLTGGVLRGNTVSSTWADAVPKMEGAQIGPAPVNRYSLNSTQLAIAKKMGMDPGHFAQQIEKYGL